jgi:hypothetical protein
VRRWLVMFRKLKWTGSEVINVFNAVQMIRAWSVLNGVKECLSLRGGFLFACRRGMVLTL